MLFGNSYNRVKDIYEVPCAHYIGGKPAIKVYGDFAFVQHPDGMTIYKYSTRSEMWERVKTIVCTNF